MLLENPKREFGTILGKGRISLIWNYDMMLGMAYSKVFTNWEQRYYGFTIFNITIGIGIWKRTNRKITPEAKKLKEELDNNIKNS